MSDLSVPFASESGHWYDRDGAPRYEITGANGKIRPTTLRDAKKHGFLPSVTTICKVVAAPGLENWKAEQLLLAALTSTRREGESDREYMARIREDAKAQAMQAADFGTRVHAAIERHYQNKPYDSKLALFVAGAVEEVEKHFPGGGWVAEKTIPNAGAIGYGGKVDLHRPYIIVDFKGKDGDLSDVACYDEHHMQAAAYWTGMFPQATSYAVTANCFFSRTHPGVAKMVIHDPENFKRGLAMFRAAKALWIAKNNYDPREYKTP